MGNMCQEYIDEWGLGDLLCLVEDGLGGQLFVCFVVVGFSSMGNYFGECIQVVIDGVWNLVQDGNSWIKDEYEDGKQCGYNYVGVGDILNVFVYVGYCGK